MAAEDDGESLREEGDQRNVDLALQAVYKGTSRGKWSFGMGQSWNEKRYQSGKGGKGGRKEPMTEGQWQEWKQRAREKWQGRNQSMLDLWQTGHIAAWCRKGGNNNLYAIDEDDSENFEEAADNEEDLQAWCLLEESENEQWEEVISRRDKQKVKKPIKRHH